MSVVIPAVPERLRLEDKTDDFDRDYSLLWNPVRGAASYEWQERSRAGAEGDWSVWSAPKSVSTNRVRFSRDSHSSDYADHVTFSVASRPLGHAYYEYQVRACPPAGQGSCSPWSGGDSPEAHISLPNISELPASVASECRPRQGDSGRRFLVASGEDADCYDGAYTIRWKELGGYASGEVEYELGEKSGDGGGEWESLGRHSALSLELSGKDVGLYLYRVRACTSKGCAPWPENEGLFPLIEVPLMPLVENFRSDEAQNKSYDAVYSIQWTPVEHSSHYLLGEEVADGENGVPGEWGSASEESIQPDASSSCSFSNETVSCSFSEKTSGKFYRYRIRACSAQNCGDVSESVEVQVLSLGQPAEITTNLESSSSYQRNYRISWDEVTNADSYRVQELKRSVAPADGSPVWDPSLRDCGESGDGTDPCLWTYTATAADDSSVKLHFDPPSPPAGESVTGFYYYRVKACRNAEGEGSSLCGGGRGLDNFGRPHRGMSCRG